VEYEEFRDFLERSKRNVGRKKSSEDYGSFLISQEAYATDDTPAEKLRSAFDSIDVALREEIIELILHRNEVF
jgi:hypothetical protein